MIRTFKLAASALALATAVPALLVAAPAQALQAESAEPAPVVWDLTHLYASPEAWRTAYDDLQPQIDALADLEARFSESAEGMAEAQERMNDVGKEAVRLFVYATLLADEDTRITDNQAIRALGSQMFSRFGRATSWTGPATLALGEETVEAWISAEPRLEPYAFGLRSTLRLAPHTLTPDQEQIMALASSVTNGAGTIYGQLSNSDIPWPEIEIDGETVTLNSQGYAFHRANGDREVRRDVFQTFWGAWMQYQSSMGAALNTHIQGHIFNARARNYETAREAALSPSNVPVAVYDQLIAQTRDGLPTLHRYFELRGRILGVEDLAYHDIYPPLVSLGTDFSLDDAERLTLAGLEPFGEEYIEILEHGFSQDWMHAYPQPGKTSGAYMFGAAYDVHPYLLLNFQGDYDGVSTFAHEWGHAVHSVLANRNQPFATAGYATFVAEMASTINEFLLLEYMVENAQSDEERLFYLGEALEQYRGTYFRQAMFAEFEMRAHELAESGEAVTGAALTDIYLELLRDYHGADQGVMEIDPAYAMEWAYIPHFYSNFYVFQYATSITAATTFAQRLLAGEEGVQDDVLNLLRAGGSDYAYDMFVEAGVDLAEPEPYQTVLVRMNAIMDEMEAILDRRAE